MPSRLPFLLLLVVILLESLFGHAEAQGKLQKPDISVDRSVQNIRVVNITCKTKLESPISSTNMSCNLYIGDSSEPFRSTWTASKTVCNFKVNISDLQKSREVSCDYSVNTDPRSPSPRSDRTLVVGELQKPDISVDAVQNTGVVNISCQTMLGNPTFVTNISCNLYIGDSSEPFRSTWTTNEVCTFAVNVNDQLKSRKVSCDYSVNIDPHSLSPRSKKVNIVGKLSKAELKLSPAIIPIEESVNLRCRRPDSAPASHCTFTTNQRGPISGSGCERSVTGAELLRGSHSARNEITVRCFYRLEEGGTPALHSDPSTVTVLDRRKPDISVFAKHTETYIHCEAPPDITGAHFFLYSSRSRTHTKETQAGREERAVSFTVPRSSDSTLTYCCSYQFEHISSNLSDCVEAKNKDQSGRTKDQRSTTTDNPQIGATTTDNPQTAVTDSPSESARFLWRHILSALVLFAAIGILIEYFISHTPTTDAAGRKRRGSENTGQFVETVC